MSENKVQLVRSPYPLPELSREGVWYHPGPILGDKVDPTDRIWYSKLKPCERLYAHHTLNSARRHCNYHCKKIPKDSLDLVLGSVYEHQNDLFLPKNYLFMQPETLNKETWRLLRNQVKVYPKPPIPLGHGVRFAEATPVVSSRSRVHPCSLQLADEGPHTDRTNPGFSRKLDGTYYSI